MSTPESDTERLKRENDILRGLVAKLCIPCHYCGVENMAKCPQGFPGCSLADDLMIGEEETTKRILEENRQLKKKLAQ